MLMKGKGNATRCILKAWMLAVARREGKETQERKEKKIGNLREYVT